MSPSSMYTAGILPCLACAVLLISPAIICATAAVPHVDQAVWSRLIREEQAVVNATSPLYVSPTHQPIGGGSSFSSFLPEGPLEWLAAYLPSLPQVPPVVALPFQTVSRIASTLAQRAIELIQRFTPLSTAEAVSNLASVVQSSLSVGWQAATEAPFESLFRSTVHVRAQDLHRGGLSMTAADLAKAAATLQVFPGNCETAAQNTIEEGDDDDESAAAGVKQPSSSSWKSVSCVPSTADIVVSTISDVARSAVEYAPVDVASLIPSTVIEQVLNATQLAKYLPAVFTQDPTVVTSSGNDGSSLPLPLCSIDTAVVGNSPACYRLRTTKRSSSLDVRVVTVDSVDVPSLVLVALSQVAFRSRNFLSRQIMFKVLLAALLGISLVLVVGTYFIANTFQSSRLAKVGVFTAFAVGGVTAIAQGLVSAGWMWIVAQVQESVYVQIGVVAGSVASTAICFRYLGAYLSPALYSLVVFLSLYFLGAALQRNTALTMTIVFLRVASSFLWTIVRGLMPGSRGFHFLPTFSPEQALTPQGEAKDRLPSSAHRFDPYRRPLAAGVSGATTQARFKAYDDLGRDYTAKALADLAKTIRENPELASRLSNPNAVYQWAGVEDEEVSDMDDEDEA